VSSVEVGGGVSAVVLQWQSLAYSTILWLQCPIMAARDEAKWVLKQPCSSSILK
jgi:hypothetical protein